jgi:hypothetical protein
MAQLASSLRLSDGERKALMADVAQKSNAHVAKRADARYALPPEFSVLGEFFLPEGATQRVIVSLRDISRGGLAMLHGNFVHKGTKCMFVVCDKDRKPVATASGEVVRCDHIKGAIHDVGVRFTAPLPASSLIKLAGSDQDAGSPADAACTAVLPLCEELVRMVKAGATSVEVGEQVRRIQSLLTATAEASQKKAA